MEIELQPLTADDLPTLMNWVNSRAEMIQWSGPWNFDYPLDVGQLQSALLATELADGIRRQQFKAVAKETQEMLGQGGFSRIQSRTPSATIGPILVNPEARSRGVGQQMMTELVRLGFEEHQLHRQELVVFSFNQAAIACYKRVGFQLEGTMREIVEVDGQFWDMHMMSLLRHEWTS